MKILKTLFSILTFVSTFSTFSTFSYVNAQVQPLQCAVCIQAYQNEITLNNQNAVQFALNAPLTCTKATTDAVQQVSCISTFTKNANILFKNSINKNAVPATVCNGVGAIGAPCTPTVTPTPTAKPTPTVKPTPTPTAKPTITPTPTTKPTPTAKPTPTKPPKTVNRIRFMNHHLYKLH